MPDESNQIIATESVADSRISEDPPRDYVKEQADATWAAAKYAKWAVVVAAVSVAVNALVIAVALIVPLYQKSLDEVNRKIQEKDVIESYLIVGLNALQDFNAKFDSITSRDVCSDPSFIRGNFKNMLLQQIAEWQEKIRLMPSNVGIAGASTIRSDVTDGINYYNHIIWHYEDMPLFRYRPDKISCQKERSDAANVLKVLQSDLLVVYQDYTTPVERPYGVLDGTEFSPNPLILTGAIPFERAVRSEKIMR